MISNRFIGKYYGVEYEQSPATAGYPILIRGAAPVMAAFFLIFFSSYINAMGPNTAFFYGKPIPQELFTHFDRVVVEADNLDNLEMAKKGGAEIFAYISVGEVESWRSPSAPLDKGWLLGINRQWNNPIIDLSQLGWRNYLLEERMAPLWAKGFRGFFLDTLDSYQAVVDSPFARTEQAQALVEIIRAMHRRFPNVKLLFNRGFEILPETAHLTVGIAAESLFYGWDPGTQNFRPVSDNDRTWLLGKLKEIQYRYYLPITVIDYLPSWERDLARQIAQRIAALGFTPWISTPLLDLPGISTVQLNARYILVLYDSRKESRGLSQVQRRLAMPLKYLGYTVDYLDVQTSLPRYFLANHYAGIVSWFTDQVEQPEHYKEWLLRQLDSKMQVVILGHPGFAVDYKLLKRLGLARLSKPVEKPVGFGTRDALIGFEVEPPAMLPASTAWQPINQEVTVHLALKNSIGQMLAVVFTAPWGGIALDPYVLDTDDVMGDRWIINPFDFLVGALKFPSIPNTDAFFFGRFLRSG